MLLDHLSNQEVGILLATKYSENAQTLEQLAVNCETDVERAQQTINALVQKGIFDPLEQWDDSICYAFSGGDYAQAVYDEMYGPLEA